MIHEHDSKPDAFLRMIRRAQRGRHKIYLGYCAGVGKTYQMLREAHRLKRDGFDVVVAVVETHGRAETAALIEGLEVIARKSQEYRGIRVEEMDVDAVLARKPAIALVDELAHTNVPGSRNAKRYEDVAEMLEAGIHVISTLNIQHVESLYDTVEHGVGVRVRERIPDTVLADADELVNVDVTTEDLIQRLKEGKVYTAERVETALKNFFTPRNLAQLRELTLRELASQIDLRRREPSEGEIPVTPDQVMVCLSSRGPNSEKLLRYASRLAGRLNRNWYAVYVQTPAESPVTIDAQTQRLLAGTLTLAKQLGAMTFTYKGTDVAQTILQFAREYRVGHIVIGTPDRIPYWKRLLGKRTVLDRLIEEGKGLNFVVLETRAAAAHQASTEVVPTATETTEDKAPTPSPRPLHLGEMLSAKRIHIWDEPAEKDAVIAQLVNLLCADAGISNVEEVLHAVRERERQGSTFFGDGAAFPHARLVGIDSVQVALGVMHAGIAGGGPESATELVFLILSPATNATVQVQILALASRAAKDRHFVGALRVANTPAEAIIGIHDWESHRNAT